MEYLMTYGWAILVVVIVGVVLWQMGVFSPSAGTAASFSGFGNVKPVEWACDTGGAAEIYMNNGAGGSISGISGTVGGAAATCSSGNIGAGDLFSCNATGITDCSSGSAGDRYELDVSVSYTSPVGAARTSSGDVWGAIE